MIGHRYALAALRRALELDKFAHAYLLTGPRGVGRRTFALELTKLLNCEAPNPTDRPDGTCRQCSMIERNVHPDLRVVRRVDRGYIYLHAKGDPARDATDYVDFIQADAQLRPVLGRKKIYLIVNAEDLQQVAADRLLKTIEEPPSFVVFLLTTADRGGVFPTVASRCQEIRLRPSPRDELADALVGMGADEERAQTLAALSGGRQGWAVSAVRDPKLYEQQQAAVQQLVDVLDASRLGRLLASRSLSERWSNHPETVRETLRVWLSWWRDIVLIQLGLGQRAAHMEPHERQALERTATSVSARDAVRTTSALQQSLLDLDTNVNARLVLDLVVLQLPYART